MEFFYYWISSAVITYPTPFTSYLAEHCIDMTVKHPGKEKSGCCKDTVSLLAKCSDSMQEIYCTWGWRANTESLTGYWQPVCHDSGQDRVGFCSRWEEAWPRHGGYSTRPLVIAEGRGKGLSSRQRGFLPAEIMWQRELCSFVYCQQGWGVSVWIVFCFLVPTVITIVAVIVQ